MMITTIWSKFKSRTMKDCIVLVSHRAICISFSDYYYSRGKGNSKGGSKGGSKGMSYSYGGKGGSKGGGKGSYYDE